jgi:hypothetical protein
MVNIIGAEGFQGHVVYEGLDEVLQIENVCISMEKWKQNPDARWAMLPLSVLKNRNSSINPIK